ncbi:MAG: PhzF family phenazine biosynthesis protein [Deltaproteobacteria bacterium]|nr:PhzF family phenazine biosynthesis protein [Deltaproteobacteria bacterium]
MPSSLTKRYLIVDVFTDTPFEGNPLAVFPDASGMDTATMQKIAKEFNLSETTFVLPATRPDCVARVRIFTPAKEMDFAGHPTIGTGYVLMKEGIILEGTESFTLEEGVGAVPVHEDKGLNPLIWLCTPPITSGITFDRLICAQVLGINSEDLLDISPQLLSAGNPTLFIAVKDKGVVDRVQVNFQKIDTLKKRYPDKFCIFVFTPTPEGAYSRMFAPDYGIIEDPATGSSTGPLALYMMQNGIVSKDSGTRFISEQGTKMGRRSILHVHIKGEKGQDGIYIGGKVTPVAEGVMKI